MSDAASAHPTGGCLCGALRYRLARVPDDVGHCHCSLCRRSTGAPFVTWATVPRAEITLLAGSPAWFRSSPRSRRGFCPSCGTQIFFAQDAEAPADLPGTATPADRPAEPLPADDVDVTAASLDRPDLCVPTRNIWVGTRLGFLHGFDDRLPDYDDEGPAPDEVAPATGA
jgi:hypothetical protein